MWFFFFWEFKKKVCEVNIFNGASPFDVQQNKNNQTLQMCIDTQFFSFKIAFSYSWWKGLWLGKIGLNFSLATLLLHKPFLQPLLKKKLTNLTLRPLIYCMFFSTYSLYNINFIINVNDLINERTRLAVHKESFSNLLEQNGCHVTKVYYSKIVGISKKEQFILFFVCYSVCVFHLG